MDKQTVLDSLLKIRLYPKRAPQLADFTAQGGPRVALVYHPLTHRPTLRVDFECAGRRYFKPAVVSTGRSIWMREQTHALAPEFAERLAIAVAGNPKGELARARS